jgi:hemerythrin-like domain-containing protein
MKPIGPLMREHRLIERMIALLEYELTNMSDKPVNISLIITAVDFFRTYADRTHHGKEEEILFRDLAKKHLQPEHKQTMDELVQEHILGRQIVRHLEEAGNSYGGGDLRSIDEIKSCLSDLVRFYPAHIIKEDQHFFYPVLEYLSKAEQDAMLEEFWEFDRKLIHEKYLKVVEENEKV